MAGKRVLKQVSPETDELAQVLERMTATDWQKSRDRARAILGKTAGG